METHQIPCIDLSDITETTAVIDDDRVARCSGNFDTRLEALVRADGYVARRPTEWTIVVKPAPGSNYR
jgi:hypothetical protein